MHYLSVIVLCSPRDYIRKCVRKGWLLKLELEQSSYIAYKACPKSEHYTVLVMMDKSKMYDMCYLGLVIIVKDVYICALMPSH